MNQPTLQERCRRIEMLILDVDGVLSDGRIIYHESGAEIKAFHVRDGSGLKLWQRAGKRTAILSGRSSACVQVRAAELGIEPVVQGASQKLPAFEKLVQEQGVAAEQVCCIGDDIPDLPLFRRCGLAVAVADACPEVRAAAHLVTQRRGGNGAVREAIEVVLRCQGAWAKLIEAYA